MTNGVSLCMHSADRHGGNVRALCCPWRLDFALPLLGLAALHCEACVGAPECFDRQQALSSGRRQAPFTKLQLHC